jgi:hypothetical protein
VADFYKIPRATLRHRVKNLEMSYKGLSLPVKALETDVLAIPDCAERYPLQISGTKTPTIFNQISHSGRGTLKCSGK